MKSKLYISSNFKNQSLSSALLRDHALSEAGLNPEDINIECGEYGKPYIPGSNVHFNISHSGDYVICAISDCELGCDIEKIGPDKEKIAKRFFHEKESGDFYRLWTLKESFIKATGQGLHLPLSSFQIILGDEIKIEQSFDEREYYFQEFDCIPGYRCAVCSTKNELFEIIKVEI